MTETKEPYHVGRIVQLTPPLPIPPSQDSGIRLIDHVVLAPPPDTVLSALEQIREVVHGELARIEHDGCGDQCGRAWLRVEALVGRVLR